METIDFQKIRELRAEIDRLLEERPEYKPFQKMIDMELDKAGTNPHNRMAVLNNLMIEYRGKLYSNLIILEKELEKSGKGLL